MLCLYCQQDLVWNCVDESVCVTTEANQVISHSTTKSLCVFVSNWCTLQEKKRYQCDSSVWVNTDKEISAFPTAEDVAEILKKSEKADVHISVK